MRTILDQTMAPFEVVEALLAEERDHWPGWEAKSHASKSWRCLAERERREWELADTIICGSDFVVDSLVDLGVRRDHCYIVPYGYDLQNTEAAVVPNSTHPLNVLFLGTVNLRKGVPYLFQAVNQADPQRFNFRAAGPVRVSDSACRQISERIEMIGPVPRSEVSRQFEWADVLVLPTLAEGSANVCFEAMAHGVPVITTSHAGSMVRDGIDGAIVPLRDAERIARELCRFESDREWLLEASKNAVQRAAEFGWANYQNVLIESLSRVFRKSAEPQDMATPTTA